MNRILIARDFGPASANALARAIRLAGASGASIRLIHATALPERQRAPLAERLLGEARIMAEELGAPDLPISAHLSELAPAEAILDEANGFDADLIVLGTHGEPRFRDALFGTTGTHVVRHSRRPVLIVEADASEPYARALVAVEKAAGAGKLFAAAAGLAPAAELFAVHAFFPTLLQTLAGGVALDRDEAEIELELEKLIGPAPARGEESHVLVESGDPISVMMARAEEVEPNLLVMGTASRTTFLGSDAVDAMFWFDRDLLVVPERARVPA